MTRRHSLHWQLPILFSSLIVAVLAAFLWSGFTQVEATLLQAGGERAQAAADQVASILTQSAQQRVNELRRAAADAALREYLEGPTDASRQAAMARMVAMTKSAQQIVELWNSRGERVLFLSVPSGVESVHKGLLPPSGPGLSEFRAAHGGIFFETVAEIWSEAPADGTQPAAGSARRLGYLAVNRSIKTTSSIDTLSRLVGTEAAIAVGGRTGGVWTNLAKVVDAPPVDRRSGGVHTYSTADGESKLGALTPVAGTPWQVWVEFPRATILAPARAFLKRMTGIALLFILSAGALTRIISRRITAPLRELTAAAERIAAGRHSRRIRTHRRDEIGRLGHAFNAMTAQIHADSAGREAAEHALRSNQEHTLFALAAAQIGVWELAPDTGRLTWSESMNAVHGIEPDAFGNTQEAFFRTLHPDDRDKVARMTARAISDRTDLDVEFRVLQPRGGVRWVHSRARLFSAPAEPARLIGVGISITARKQAEDELRQTTDRLRAVIAHLPIALWEIDCTGIVTLFEGELTGRLGIESADAVGHSIFEIYKDAPQMLDATRRVLAGESQRWNDDVRQLAVEGSYSPVLTPGGEIIGAIGIIVDVSENRRLAAEMRQAVKMEAVGRLAGGVAHDFNNLLTVILGYTELALEALPPASSGRPDLEQIQQAATSAAGLTAQLLAFSRKQILQPQIMDVNCVVLRMDALLRRLIGEDIELVTRLERSLHRVNADPGQVEQVLVNLAVNARDAMPTGGKLTIETRNVELDAGYAAQHPGCSIGPHVMVAVSDNGGGMDDSVKAHLFEPFYTTKERGKGTGLGLATVYGIVKQSGGSIFVDSVVGHGTAFKIYLPLASPLVDESIPAAAGDHSAGGSETILLVEDQPEVAAVARAVLARNGYTVLSASIGPEALALIARYPGPIHLLLTDVIMPVMSGRELATRVVAARPSIRVLYTSGYTDDAVVTHGVLEGGVAFLQKPFTPRTLLQKTREALDPAVVALEAG